VGAPRADGTAEVAGVARNEMRGERELKKETSLRTVMLAKKGDEPSISPRKDINNTIGRKDSHSVGNPMVFVAAQEEPEHVRRIRNEVKKDVFFLIQEKRLADLEESTWFFVKDRRRNGAEGMLQLQKNHQVIQFYFPEDEKGQYFQRLFISDIVSVENVQIKNCTIKRKQTVTSQTNLLLPVPEEAMPPALYTIKLLRRNDQETMEFSTDSEADHQRWLEGLEALLGAVSANTQNSTLATMNLLTDIEMELRMLQYEEGGVISIPPVPLPPQNYNFVDAHLQENRSDEKGIVETKHWKTIFHLA